MNIQKQRKKKKKNKKKRAVGMALRSFKINFFVKESEVVDRELRQKNDREGIRLQMGSTLFGFFMSTETCDALIGDLEEAFTKTTKSNARAHLWYWSQVFRSLVPIAWAALIRKIQGVSIRTRL